MIYPANIQDRDGAIPLLRAARRLFPFVEVIFADGAYQGDTTRKAVARTGCWRLEIVKRSQAAGFEPLPKRWIVEIVFTQMAKPYVLALGRGGQHVADLDLVPSRGGLELRVA